jgi:hypothetical protein
VVQALEVLRLGHGGEEDSVPAHRWEGDDTTR